MSDPKLMAEFVTGPDGQPTYVSGSDGTKKHYNVRLYIDSPPTWATLATYRLHPTYRNATREVSVGNQNFEEFITAYGDFEMLGSLMGANQASLPPTWLSKALEDRYQGENNPAISSAIGDIKQN